MKKLYILLLLTCLVNPAFAEDAKSPQIKLTRHQELTKQAESITKEYKNIFEQIQQGRLT